MKHHHRNQQDTLDRALRTPRPILVIHVHSDDGCQWQIAQERLPRVVAARSISEEDPDESVSLLEGGGTVLVDDGESKVSVNATNLESGVEHGVNRRCL
jgi:hypothetical protein